MHTDRSAPRPDLHAVAERLGMQRAKNRKWTPCPACGYDGPRPAVVLGRGFWCARCDARGDVYDLVAFKLRGRRVDRDPDTYRAVREWLDGGPALRPSAVRDYKPPSRVPEHELAAALSSCTPATKAAERHAGLRAFLARRGLTGNVYAGLMPAWFRSEWWPYGQEAPLVVPAYNGHGQLRGLQGRDIRPPERVRVKTRWPRGHDASGLLFADPVSGRPLLRGIGDGPRDVVIVEGLTDYLWAAQEASPDLAVLGVASGSASALRLVSFPPHARITIGTHADPAGDAYAQSIADALSPRLCHRIPLHLAGD